MASAETPRLIEPLEPATLSPSVLAIKATSADVDLLQQAKAALPEGVDYMVRVRLNLDVLRSFHEIEVSAEGKTRLATRIESYWRTDAHGGETFVLDTGEKELAVFTTFANGHPAFGHFMINGVSYFVSGEGDHYVVTRSSRPPQEEIVHPIEQLLAEDPVTHRKAMMQMMLEAQAKSLTVTTNDRRHSCCTFYETVPVVTAVGATYVKAVGEKDGFTAEQRVAARVVHTFDRMNVAYRNSGAYRDGRLIRMFNREIAYITVPQDVLANRSIYGWAKDPTNPVVRDIRKRNKAAGALILEQEGNVAQATLNNPDPAVPVIPDWNIAVAGGYTYDWDDGDMKSAGHEWWGHVFGVKHNVEDMPVVPDDPFDFRHDFVDCDRGKFLTSYNPCGQWVPTVELFSGAKAKEMGYTKINLETQDAVRAIRMMAKKMARDFE